MQKNLFLQLALKLNSKEFPSLLKTYSKTETFFYFLLQCLGFCIGKILFLSSSVSNAFVRFTASKQAKILPKQNLEFYAPAKKFLQQNPKTAVLFLVSHPLTTPDQAPLLAQMLYVSAQIARYLNPQKIFRLVHAVDHFALDSLPLALRGFYSGLVLSRHVAVHRSPQDLSAFEKSFWKAAQYYQTIFEMVRALKKGDFVFAALSGGISANARIFYTVKEWAYRIYRQNNLHVKGVQKSVFAFSFVQTIFDQDDSVRSQAALSSAKEDRVLKLLTEILRDFSLAQKYCQELAQEMKLETPYRARLFKILFARVCGKQPLMIVALHHKLPSEIKAELPAIILNVRAKSSVTVQQGFVTTTLPIEQFIFDFVQNHLQPEL